MLRQYEPSGPYATRAAACYPEGLNICLLRSFLAAPKQQPTTVEAPMASMAEPGDLLRRRVHCSETLRGQRLDVKARRRVEDDKSLGGLRNCHTVVRRLPGHQ